MVNNTKKTNNPLMREKRNIYIGRNRTSLSFETYVWENIDRIAKDEGLSVDDICSKIDEFRGKKGTLSTLIRFIVHEVTHMRVEVPVEEEETLAERGQPFPSPLYMALTKLKQIQSN